MTLSVAQGESLMRSPAQKYHSGTESWSGWCAAFVFRFGGFTKSADTAALAFKASGKVVSKVIDAAPAGAIHWWSGGDGHVAVSLGNGLAAMASARVQVAWGADSGTTVVSLYNSATDYFLTYEGWTYDFCGERIADIEKLLTDEAAKAKAAEEAAAQSAVTIAQEAVGVLLAKEASHPEVYLISGVTKRHLLPSQAAVYHLGGYQAHEVADGGLADFALVK